MQTSLNVKRLVFVLVTLVCLAVGVLYTLLAARKANPSIGKTQVEPVVQSSSPSTPDSPTVDLALQSPNKLPTPRVSTSRNSAAHSPEKLDEQIHAKPYLVAINLRHSADLGKVEFSALDIINEQRTATNLRCERIYFAADRGICLSRQLRMFTAQTVATLVNANFQPTFTVRTDGIPTRARVSPDGRFAAFTVFLTGHSYGDAQMSTATLLLNVDTGATVANLEEFKVLQDGNLIKALDFNYWGVTFQHDSNFFYATLRTAGTNYLVHGDIKGRTLTVIYKGVECPSLSPDEKRIAFKKMISRNNWRLAVLDLNTFAETPLAETRSVDDQPEWLDNDHVLYAMVDPAPWMSIMVVPADGSGQANVFAKGATSPAVVRWMKSPPGSPNSVTVN